MGPKEWTKACHLSSHCCPSHLISNLLVLGSEMGLDPEVSLYLLEGSAIPDLGQCCYLFCYYDGLYFIILYNRIDSFPFKQIYYFILRDDIRDTYVKVIYSPKLFYSRILEMDCKYIHSHFKLQICYLSHNKDI